MTKNTVNNIQIILMKDRFYSENILVTLDNLNKTKPRQFAYFLRWDTKT